MIKPCYTFTDEDLHALFDGKSSSFPEAKLKLIAATGLDLDCFGKTLSSYCLYRMFEWEWGATWSDVIFGNDANFNVIMDMLKESDLMDQAFSERYDWDWKARRYVTMRDFENSFLLFRMMRARLDLMYERINGSVTSSSKKDCDMISRYGRFLDAAEMKVFKLPDEDGV